MAIHHLWRHGNSKKKKISMLIYKMEIAQEVEKWLHGSHIVYVEVFAPGKKDIKFFRKIEPSSPLTYHPIK